ncbi:hypothetical protein IU448_20390 [Nocardia flavorosea]|uniref:hypothetical protein n=1 Tax=Nocardia flavorosea TaxID=53429 RepID=UPI0018961419|nr:hypothetical protein [Nocardia flavorosea]MBF6351355.1 hypothetical protein [Nocardia flavorosea]
MTGPVVTDDGDVSAGDAFGWLHEEGLARLAALGQASGPAAAFTVDVATGMVTMFPVTGADSAARAADDLPAAAENTGRLVAVGLTSAGALLVVDLSGSLMVALNGDRPELAARSWVTQLLLNPDITLTTNSSAVALGASPRCRKSFIPGGGGDIISVDDGTPPVTTIAMNSDLEGSDYLERSPDGSGEMYLGPRYWQLSHVMTIADGPWAALAATLDEAGK